MPANAPCCNCPARIRECVLPFDGPANGCYKNANGDYQDFASFRDLYEQYCLAKKTVDPRPTGVTGPVPRSGPVDVSVTCLVTLLGVRVMCVVRRCGCGRVEGDVNEVGEEWVVGSVCGWMEEVGKGVGGVG